MCTLHSQSSQGLCTTPFISLTLMVLVRGLLVGFSMDNYFHSWYYLNFSPSFLLLCLTVCTLSASVWVSVSMVTPSHMGLSHNVASMHCS